MSITLTSSFGNGTPTTFTMNSDVVNELLVFLLRPCSFIDVFFVTTRFSHSRTRLWWERKKREWKLWQMAKERVDGYIFVKERGWRWIYTLTWTGGFAVLVVVVVNGYNCEWFEFFVFWWYDRLRAFDLGCS